MGLGMPTSLAMVSEMAPADPRAKPRNFDSKFTKIPNFTKNQKTSIFDGLKGPGGAGTSPIDGE